MNGTPQGEAHAPRDNQIKVLGKAIDVLVSIGSGPKSIRQIAEMTGIPTSSAYRIVQTLRGRHLVSWDEGSSTYRVGLGVLRLISDIQDPLVRGLGATYSVLERMRMLTTETTTVHVRLGSSRLCVAELESEQSVKYSAGKSNLTPLHVGSAGRVLLAATRAEFRREELTHLKLEKCTPDTITDIEEILRRLDAIDTRGFDTSFGERTPGSAAISVAIRANDELVASLSVLGPASRLSSERLEGFIPWLNEAATELSKLYT